MTHSRISAALRREVRARAGKRCEYCLLAESQAFFPHEPDHLIALKHGGETTLGNLALACFDCNRFKGSDIASIDEVTGELTLLFNPRTQQWRDHFEIKVAFINPLTAIGRVTERLLQLNLASRLEIRQRLAILGEYPLKKTRLEFGSRHRKLQG